MTSSYIFLLLLFLSAYGNYHDQCSIRDSCSNSTLISPSIYKTEQFIQSRNCFCDSYCKQYNDCCQQSFTTSPKNFYECTDFLSPTSNDKPLTFQPISVWMRTRCLRIYHGTPADLNCRNHHDQTFQTNPSLFIPVTSVESNITYRNYFCAYCNNELDTHIQYWRYIAICREDLNISSHEVILNKNEDVNYYLNNLTGNCTKSVDYPQISGLDRPSVFIRACKKVLPRTCPIGTPTELAQKCLLASNAYRYDNNTRVTYPNQYCADCHRKSPTQITCLDPTPPSGRIPSKQRLFPPLSILFNPALLKRNFHSNLSNEMIYSVAYNCTKSTEYYHLFQKQCLPSPESHQQILLSFKCDHPVLTLDKFIRFHNGSLYLINQSIYLTKHQYALLNDHQVFFCADQRKRLRPTFPFYRHILSMFCTSISLFFLFLFMIVFRAISSLHNLPGKCLLCLSISIFLGQTIFLMTSDLHTLSLPCLIFGILIHYFYLSSFFWLFIIASGIHSTFHHQQLGSREKLLTDNQYLSVYNVLVWCSAGFVILLACLIQIFSPQSSFSPNYGYSFCSISQPKALITFFLLPIGCLLLLIIILFIKTISAIHDSRKAAKLANTSSNDSYVMIYARLASLMGLQWILLINAVVIRQTWAWILFEVINSLPGIFICFGFLCSRRVWKEMKANLTKKSVSKRKTSSSQTTAISLMVPLTQRDK
ncbi:unnamed protein product [Adineta ricciae]|uniref:G-protein coupled receptors family 2 profile 2 domain-containing protein n=1 Tax=Adineta ricciae TaxID=249248 RepID=A0A813SKJ6_ADIRI|nr:unnamed protein product [Adineta ricciae]CAF1554416.1 unnamed protein product [Adineta ricciae]